MLSTSKLLSIKSFLMALMWWCDSVVKCSHLVLPFHKLLLSSTVKHHCPSLRIWLNTLSKLLNTSLGLEWYLAISFMRSECLEFRTEMVHSWMTPVPGAIPGILQGCNKNWKQIKKSFLTIQMASPIFWLSEKRVLVWFEESLMSLRAQIYFFRELIKPVLEKIPWDKNPKFTNYINTHSVTSGDEGCGPWAFCMASMLLRVIQPVAVKQTQMLIWEAKGG